MWCTVKVRSLLNGSQKMASCQHIRQARSQNCNINPISISWSFSRQFQVNFTWYPETVPKPCRALTSLSVCGVLNLIFIFENTIPLLTAAAMGTHQQYTQLSSRYPDIGTDLSLPTIIGKYRSIYLWSFLSKYSLKLVVSAVLMIL